MKTIVKQSVFIYLLTFIPIVLQAQAIEQFIDPIETGLKVKLGEDYELITAIPTDSAIGTNKGQLIWPLDDPYYTLKGTVLFSARNSAPDWIWGIYSSQTAQIEWTSEPNLDCNDVYFYGAMDLNLDKNVDIAVNCLFWSNSGITGYLWLYSWDGDEAKRISDSYGANSLASVSHESFGYIDLNGDGIMEIRGKETKELNQWSYWSWNGETYGDWPTTPSPPSGPFYPADMAEGDVHVEVTDADMAYSYLYTINSDSSSKRRIAVMHLDHGKQDTVGSAPKGWKFYGGGRPEYPLTWMYMGANTRYMIEPNGVLSDFFIHSSTPPKPYSYYLRAEHRLPDHDHPDYSFVAGLNDIRTNSHKGITLAPGPDLAGFNNNQLTDSLYNFVDRSCTELGWATDAGVCGELEGDLSQIKTALQAGDSLSAANTLVEFIALVEAEKDASLTSEGYALLYFNAEYLAERLPEPQEPNTGSGITCGCDNPVTQSSGTITIENGDTRCLNTTFSGSVFFQSGGTLNVCSVATLQNVYGNQPGHIYVSETGEVTVGNWNNNFSEDAFTNWGTTTFSGWTTVNNGSLTNHGTLTVGGGLNQNNGALSNSGTLSVNRSVNINRDGVQNTGYWSIGQSLTLNSNAEVINECRVEVGNQLMINGVLESAPGSFVSAGGQLTINSGGRLSLGGNQAMATFNGVMLNGTIESTGANLMVTGNTFNFNSGAAITAGGEPLYLVAPNLSDVSASFNVADGSALVVPATACNPQGYNDPEN